MNVQVIELFSAEELAALGHVGELYEAFRRHDAQPAPTKDGEQ